ncbi:DUF805 domain-containing protein [Pseudomonas sp. SBB6]|uniref:DUF805 domain-containing protein n=1 Tax=Pseudomonas sp. SBB6 TaxID=2962032 RepID=UPI0020B752AA|nr:DUF805 domain-containing protein [Pseudomonas sp. SBB6]MCP3748792.1 DUF805 domain-containing protein [Pseudomonas sp. SBB6]
MNNTLTFANELMSPQGRIGRLRLLAWSLGLIAGTVACALLLGWVTSAVWKDAGALFLIAALIARIMSMIFFVKRLHDLNWSGWFCWAVLLPWVGNFLLLLLLVMPGKRGNNRFGPAPPPNSMAVVILASMWLVVIVGAVVLTVFRPGI